jgi:hypothetical protein
MIRSNHNCTTSFQLVLTRETGGLSMLGAGSAFLPGG